LRDLEREEPCEGTSAALDVGRAARNKVAAQIVPSASTAHTSRQKKKVLG
jgi:hypothetical protein